MVWVPTTEHTLEDAILMIAVYVLRNAEVLARLSEFGFDPARGIRDDRQPVEPYSAFTEDSERNSTACAAACRRSSACRLRFWTARP